jgi:hypothetical protein
MAALTTIAVAGKPDACTVTLSGAVLDLNGTTAMQLKHVIDSIVMAAAQRSSDSPAAVTYDATARPFFS